MAGMYVHSAHLWLTACEARDRAVAAARANPDAWPSDAIVAILLAAASAEAFINEFAEILEMDKSDLGHRQLLPPLRACADALVEVEDARGSLSLKYLIASQILSGSMFDKGSNPYQDFAVLIKLRNDLMHLKPQDTFVHSVGSTAVQVPKYIEALQQRGLARTPSPKVGISWFNRLQTAEMAKWACDTAHAIILAVLAMVPDDPVPAKDPSWMFKHMFRR